MKFLHLTMIALFTIISSPVFAIATISANAAYLPDRMMWMMPELKLAIELVAREHSGCDTVSNASFSESFATATEPAYFVTCEMKTGDFPYQNVFVRRGKIIDTTP